MCKPTTKNLTLKNEALSYFFADRFLPNFIFLLAAQDCPKFFKTGERLLLINIDELYQPRKALGVAAVSAIDPDNIALHEAPSVQGSDLAEPTLQGTHPQMTHGFFFEGKEDGMLQLRGEKMKLFEKAMEKTRQRRIKERPGR